MSPSSVRTPPAQRRKARRRRLRRIPWGLARQFLEQAAAEGFDSADAIDTATLILDAAMPLQAVVPGPAGVALEAVDGPLIRAGLTLMWAVIEARVDAPEVGPPPPPSPVPVGESVMSQSFLSAELIPAWIRIPVGFGLIGLAYAQDAPGTHVVASPLGDLALANLTLPVAMVVFGSQLGRMLTTLSKWRPHVIVEHRHVRESADDTPTST